MGPRPFSRVVFLDVDGVLNSAVEAAAGSWLNGRMIRSEFEELALRPGT